MKNPELSEYECAKSWMIRGVEFGPNPGNLFCQKILSPEEFDFCQNFHLFENGLSLFPENILV